MVSYSSKQQTKNIKKNVNVVSETVVEENGNIDGSYLKFQTVAFNALHSFDQIVIKPLLPNSTILSFSVFSSYYTVWFFLSLPNENLALILTLPLSLRCVCPIYIYDNLFLYSYFFIYFFIICFIKLESTPLVMEKYDMA
jgi:hypothetical protein